MFGRKKRTGPKQRISSSLLAPPSGVGAGNVGNKNGGRRPSRHASRHRGRSARFADSNGNNNSDHSMGTMDFEGQSSEESFDGKTTGSCMTLHEKNIAKNENKTIQQLRVFILFLIMSVLIFTTFGVDRFSHGKEVELCEIEFEKHGTQVLEAFEQAPYQTTFQVLEVISTAVTSYATATTTATTASNHNSTTSLSWTFVTIQDSANVFRPFLSLSNATVRNLALGIMIKDWLPDKDRLHRTIYMA